MEVARRGSRPSDPCPLGRAAWDESLGLVVGGLSLIRRQGAIFVVAGEARTAVDLQRLIEALVRQVRDVEDHADALHLAQQRRPWLEQSAFGPGAVGVG